MNDFTKSKKITLHMKSGTGLKRIFRFKSTIIKPAASLGIRLKRDYDKSIHNVSIFIENLIVNSHAFIASQSAVTAHGTPDAALFLPKDRIFAINGKDAKDYDMPQIVNELRSIGEGMPIVFDLVRVRVYPKNKSCLRMYIYVFIFVFAACFIKIDF